MRTPTLRLDLDAVERNALVWKSRLGACALWPVVKSNGYRLGAVAVARACIRAGAQRLVIVDVDEAVSLRAAGIEGPLLQICSTPRAALADAVRLGVIPTVDDRACAKALSSIAMWRGQLVRAHVAVDTGTGWSGVPAFHVGSFARDVVTLPGIEWEGAWTHIAGAATLHDQSVAFAGALDDMRRAGLKIPIAHIASTGPVVWGAGGDAARIGVGLYGAAFGDVALAGKLRTAVDLRATVASVKRFDAPTPLGYGGSDVAQPGDVVATLRIGYADGLPRTLRGGGGVRLRGTYCRIAGAIGMNFTMVKLAPEICDAVVPGDDAVIIGDADRVRLEEVAGAAGVIPQELISRLGAALKVIT